MQVPAAPYTQPKNVGARLHAYRITNDITWPKLTKRINKFLISCGLRGICQTALFYATKGRRISARTASKIERFLEAHNA